MNSDSIHGSCDRSADRVRQTLPATSNQDGRGSARQALQGPPATQDAGEAINERSGRTPGAVDLIAPTHRPNRPSRLSVVSVLGSDPYCPTAPLKALRAGRTSAEVCEALIKLMPRTKAQRRVNAAKACLARERAGPQIEKVSQ